MIKSMKKGFTLIELMIVVAIIGILAAIAIPNFIKFQARSKQSEVKANLKAAYTAQKAYMQEKDKYVADINEIGFSPERGNRYAYYLSATDFQTRTGTQVGTGVGGIEVDTFKHDGAAASPTPATAGAVGGGGATPYSFIITAAGNVDNDPDLDLWSVADETRSDGNGTTSYTQCGTGNNPAGEPCLDVNDV